MKDFLKKLGHGIVMFWLSCQPPYERWVKLCNLNRDFQRAQGRWIRSKHGTPEEKERYRELSKMRTKLNRLGESLGMSEGAAELPLPMRYRFQGTPPMPKWLKGA